jgi:hypothetical protein
LAPYYHYVNNGYSEWLNEDKAVGIADPALKPMSLDEFKQSGILQIWTPEQAIDKFQAMQSRISIEHFMMMMPPGLPQGRFREYAQLFADQVLPAFR